MTHQLIRKWETSYLGKNSNSPTSINWQFFKHPFSRKSTTICLCFHRHSQTCCCSGQRSGCWHHGDDSRPVWRCLCDGRRHIRHTIQQARTVAGGMFDLHVLQVRKPFPGQPPVDDPDQHLLRKFSVWIYAGLTDIKIKHCVNLCCNFCPGFKIWFTNVKVPCPFERKFLKGHVYKVI